MRPETIELIRYRLLGVLVVAGVANRRAGQMAVVDPLLKLPLAALADRCEVVDPVGSAAAGWLGAWVHVTLDHARHRQPLVMSVQANLDVGQLERIEDQIHPPARQPRVDLVGVPVHPERPVRDTVRRSDHRNASRSARSLGTAGGPGRGTAPRCLLGLRVHSPVIDLFNPRLEGPQLLKA